MPGVPRELAEHHLHVRPEAKPVKQPLRRFAEERRKAIGEEIARLLAAGFIMEVLHPDWLANPVLVLKKNGSWRMCIDYTSLNKACLLSPEFDRIRGQPESRSRLVFNVYVYAMQETKRSKSITFLIRYRSGGTPLHQHRTCVPRLCGPSLEGPGPAAVPEPPGSTVLPVAARRWVSTATHSGTPGGTVFDINASPSTSEMAEGTSDHVRGSTEELKKKYDEGTDLEKQTWLAKYATPTNLQSSTPAVGSELEKQAWLAKYATPANLQSSTPAASTADQISTILRDQFGMVPKRRAIGYSKPYPNEYDLIPLPPKYRLPEFSKFSGRVGGGGSRITDQGCGLPSDYPSLAHMVQKRRYMNSATQVYQDKFKRAVVLVEADEDEGSAGDQEVAVAEWTRGASPVSCKWVKPQGPPRGFDFDVTKAEQIFDLLLKEKQLKVPEGHKIPTSQELNGKPYKWHNTFTHTTNGCRVWRRQIQMAIEQGRLIFSQYAMKVDTHPFPAVNMVECTYPGRCQPGFSFNINMVGPVHHPGKDRDEGSCSHNKDKEEAVPRDRLRHDGKRYITEGEVKNVRYQRPLSDHLLNKNEPIACPECRQKKKDAGDVSVFKRLGPLPPRNKHAESSRVEDLEELEDDDEEEEDKYLTRYQLVNAYGL
ncbi:hypothetical protein QYE76_067315 [Lolium multiflorum]|uniref:Uncharacterized protein n=1 Tax=Lolium multiflorum TaxID=4521 RepID=A0AAD8SCG1_LOLMU|nr:hypothetical protein QYE76_067315 [Lolium multiflorum]